MFLWPENWLGARAARQQVGVLQGARGRVVAGRRDPWNAERLYRSTCTSWTKSAGSRSWACTRMSTETATPPMLHVFGRTRDIPHLYFYRRWEDEARWTPWERSISTSTRDHLIPVVYNGRLYLFWPSSTITEPDQPRSIAEMTAGGLTIDLQGVDRRAAELNRSRPDKRRIARSRPPRECDSCMRRIPGLLIGMSGEAGARERSRCSGVLDDLVTLPRMPRYLVDIRRRAWHGLVRTLGRAMDRPSSSRRDKICVSRPTCSRRSLLHRMGHERRTPAHQRFIQRRRRRTRVRSILALDQRRLRRPLLISMKVDRKSLSVRAHANDPGRRRDLRHQRDRTRTRSWDGSLMSPSVVARSLSRRHARKNGRSLDRGSPTGEPTSPLLPHSIRARTARKRPRSS